MYGVLWCIENEREIAISLHSNSGSTIILVIAIFQKVAAINIYIYEIDCGNSTRGGALHEEPGGCSAQRFQNVILTFIPKQIISGISCTSDQRSLLWISYHLSERNR